MIYSLLNQNFILTSSPWQTENLFIQLKKIITITTTTTTTNNNNNNNNNLKVRNNGW